MIDFVYNKKVLSVNQVRTDVQFMMNALIRNNTSNIMLQFTTSVNSALH